MPVRLLLFFLCCSALLHAQAPGTASRGDIDGRYQRPDLTARIFDAAAAKLSPEQTDAIVRDLVLIARNFPDNIRITHRVRSRALAVALRLSPDDRAAVVANGQLARGMVPAPVPCDPPASLGGIAARLRDVAMPMIEAPENAARQLALLLLDLCTTLDPPAAPRDCAPHVYGRAALAGISASSACVCGAAAWISTHGGCRPRADAGAQGWPASHPYCSG